MNVCKGNASVGGVYPFDYMESCFAGPPLAQLGSEAQISEPGSSCQPHQNHCDSGHIVQCPYSPSYCSLGASALGLRREWYLTKQSLALRWGILMVMKLQMKNYEDHFYACLKALLCP